VGDARRRSRAASCWLSKVKQLNRRTTMRVNAGFSRLLRLDGIWVRSVRFNEDRVTIHLALRRRRLCCPLCGFSTPHRHNLQQVESVWRHLDLGVWRLELHAQLRRLECPEHGVRVEGVPFARHASDWNRSFGSARRSANTATGSSTRSASGSTKAAPQHGVLVPQPLELLALIAC
jgi:transposase